MIGSWQEFCVETELVTAYLEHVQLFMQAKGVEDGKKVAVILIVIGGKTYNLLRSFLSPAAPGGKSYNELMKVLKVHFELKSSVIAERFHFHRCMQAPGDLVAN